MYICKSAEYAVGMSIKQIERIAIEATLANGGRRDFTAKDLGISIA